MADFDQLKQKYQPVLDVIQKEGAQIQGLGMDGNQLSLKVLANSEASKNRIWDAIKAVDPNYSDLKHDIQFREGQQTYTVRPATTYRKSASSFMATQTNTWR